MYCRALACDFDGTGAVDGRLAPEVAEALRAARGRGIATLLVTGRVVEELEAADVDFAAFDAVVAENGAVVRLPAAGRTIQLGTPPPEHFLGELRARGIAFQAGAVVVGGIADHHAAGVLEVIRHLGLDAQIAFNRSVAMVLPSGVNKATGVRRALEELGRSEHNLIAFGDAENDCSLLQAAEVGVAARGALPALALAADDQLTQSGGVGVARYVERMLARDGFVPTPPRRHVVIGRDTVGAPATLPAAGVNLMVSGDPRSGKSWLAGLVIERLLECEYRLCIIDPEGDYLALGPRPRILVLGHDVPLPDAGAVPRILRDESMSLVLNLAGLTVPSKAAYVDALLCGLDAVRARSGMPHWTVIDEAHYFFHARSPCTSRLESRTGSFVFVTYRPGLVADVVHASVGAHLVTRTEVEEERYFVTSLLQSRGPAGLVAADALAEVQMPRAGLLVEGPAGPRWQVFTPGERVTAQAHHGRKYADARLAESKAFRFLFTNGDATVAHNVSEFCAAVRTVPVSSLRLHLLAGDFSRWASGVLGDPELAGGLGKLENTTRAGAPPSRDEILEHLRDRYLV